MDIQSFDKNHITVTGTRAEFGFIATSADAAAAASKGAVALGVSHDIVSEGLVGGLKDKLAVVPGEDGIMTARLSVGMARLAVRGAMIGVAKIDETLAVLGPDAQQVTYPLHARKVEFSAVIGVLQPPLEQLKLDQMNGNNS